MVHWSGDSTVVISIIIYSPHRVSLLVATGAWSVLMVYLLSQAQHLETKVESNVHTLSNYLVGIKLEPELRSVAAPVQVLTRGMSGCLMVAQLTT